ncbi:hypothetical protein SAY86_028924 [Trapa natans]|uniref:Uncharacterized protein n=1 Tax=Trapa natans TaxID=22666 RepID=A0AAN7MJS0_TRANT|nr:hypothetical protein SAY86_028924 [Trapa natans]
MQSNSLESFGLSQSKWTVELIPDDDDLLSSILVGRRSSAHKMKPTPALLELISSKCPGLDSMLMPLKGRLSTELFYMHNETYGVSGTKICA